MGGSITRMFFGKTEVRVIIQGLDAAGKTTMLYRLKLGEVVTTIPTIGFNVETVEHKNISMTAWDVGGRDKIRPLFRHYYPNTDAVIFVVDSYDRERITEARDEIKRMLSEDELRDCPVLVVANKQDLPNAMSAIEIQEALELSSFRNRKYWIVPAVATTGDGLYEGLDWLSAAMGKQKATKSVSKPIKQTASSVSQTVTKSSYLSKSLHIIKSWFTS